MLRVTVEERGERVIFRLEGKLKGPWVTELERCWRSTSGHVTGKTFGADLDGVDFIDDQGKALLKEMAKAGVELIATESMMRSTIQQILAKPCTNSSMENTSGHGSKAEFKRSMEEYKMDETFWTVEFTGAAGVSAGVVIFTKGKIFGGNSGQTFMGTYDGDSNVKGNISVHTFDPGFNGTGTPGDCELEFSGTVEGKTMIATANVVGDPGRKFTARLTKVSDLPEERAEWSAVPRDDINLATSSANS
jgi:hypothetical protein